MKKFFSLILAVMTLAGALSVAVAAESSPFTDVKTSRWSYRSIVYAYDNGLMDGVGNGKFEPAGTMTRGMVVTVLYRMENSPEVAFKNEFSDVKSGKYYSKAVIWAKNNNIVNGVSEGKFDPGGKITREQLSTMLYRYAEFSGLDTVANGDLNKFPDAGKTHSYARTALIWATDKGLVTGVKSGSVSLLDPRGNATREQFATILMRYCESDLSARPEFNEPVLMSRYTEPDYATVEDADVYVSTNGDDGGDGSKEHPVATFAKALEMVREIRTEKASGDVVVAFMAGNYGPLQVSLTPEDSGNASQRIVFCKYGDGDVVFDNGIDVTENDFSPLSDSEKALFSSAASDKIRKADLSGKLVDYDPRTCMVISASGACTLARYPNKFENGEDDLLAQAGETISKNEIRIHHPLITRRVAKYHTTEGLLLYGYLTTGWYKDLLTTSDYNPDTGVFYIPHPEEARMGFLRLLPEFDSGYWNKTALVNISEELDAAGEYWIDKDTSILYVYDPQGDYHLTGGNETRMIYLDQTDFITFRGLTFKNSDGPFIYGNHCTDEVIDQCVFTCNAYGEAVDFERCPDNTPFNITVTRSTFSVTAAYGLCIRNKGGAGSFDRAEGVVVDNNYFTQTGLIKGNTGALSVNATGPVVTHNEFRDCCWEGVDFRGSSGMTLEYNVFNNVCCNGDDTGAVNNWNSVNKCGNIVRNNLFMNIAGGSNGRYSLYLDDSAGTQVHNNLFYNCGHTVMNGGITKFNTFCDNIIINPESNKAVGCDYHYATTLLTEEAAAAGNVDDIKSDHAYVRWVEAFGFFDAYPELKTRIAAEWPGYFDITTDTSRWEEDLFCMNASLVITGNREFNLTGASKEYDETFAKHSVIENNLSYSVDENLFFIDPSLGDYRLLDGVEGFPEIELEKIGRY